MGDFKKPTSEEEFSINFSQLKPLMDVNMAYYESSRCLFCYDAPCVKACPTGIDIPLFIKQINTHNITGAARTIYSSNYFGHTCGKVCPTEVLCEGACVYNEQDVKPIEIGRLQSHATTLAIYEKINLFTMSERTGRKVAIIGAGPAGVSCACELSLLGIDAVIFEAKSRPSGLALHGTAPYKITNMEVLEEVRYLQNQFEFDILYDHPVYSKDDFTKIENEFDAIFIGVGLGQTRRLHVPGEDLGHNIGATEFIEQLKINPLEVQVGQDVIVIGGGNTAMDAASESARLGANVTLLYRRSRSEMGAYEFEFDLIRSVGAKAIFNTTVLELLGEENVQEVKCIRTMNYEGVLEEIRGSEFTIPCDFLIRATGQEKQVGLYDMIGLEYDTRGRLTVNPATGQCSLEKYFAGGDAVNGGAEVVNACAEGKKAAQGIKVHLEN